MLKSFVEKIASMAKNEVHEINGEFYSDKPMSRVVPVEYLPEEQRVYSLAALITLIKAEVDKIKNCPIFVEVISEKEVVAYTTYDNKFRRSVLYHLRLSEVGNSIGYWEDKEESIIQLKSVYKPSEGVNYILGILSSISDESSVQTKDDGISQTVEVRKGIAMKAREDIKTVVRLAPYRTFLEVEQPESDFILRLKEGGRILIKEADGGKWKLDAKRNIANYLAENLQYEEVMHKVVVTA